MRYVRAAGLLAVAASLAVPVAASAHPTTYTAPDGARVDADPSEPVEDWQLVDRYVVVNHGYSIAMQETNELDAAAGGVVSYALIPGAFREGMTAAEMLEAASSGAQAHATCLGGSPLDDEASVLGWQGDEPFYGYVPFQKASAGIDDHPEDWIAAVKDETTVDLSTVSDDPDTAATQLEALCEEAAPDGLGGQFFAADRNLNSNLAGGLVADAVDPLNAEIASLEASLTSTQQARNAAQASLAAARTSLAAANTELARVMPLTRAFNVALPSANMKTRTLAREGVTVSVTGPPLQTIALKLTMPAKAAKRVGLKSGVLARTTASIGAGGSTQATLKPKRSVARKLRRLRGSARMTVAAAGGDRADAARGTVSR